MNRAEHAVASAVLRVLGWIFDRLPIRRRVVLATARLARLEGNLAFLDAEIRRARPDVPIVALLEPYHYGFIGKLAYMARLLRGIYYVRTSSLVIVDNAYLPVHVAPHRPGVTVVQVWHAVGALKRFGADVVGGLRGAERDFLHRHYDYVVCAGERSRGPWAAALRTPVERVLPLGVARTDLFFDADAMAARRERLLTAYPVLRGHRVVVYAPTFRGRGRGKHPGPGLDTAAVRAALPDGFLLALKSHPNLDPRLVDVTGYDVVFDPGVEMNDIFTITDVLVTDYSSSIFEWALLRRPLVLVLEDLETYERDPGLYLDPRHDLIGTTIEDPDDVAAAVARAAVDPARWDAFVAAQIEACDGGAAARIVERFLPT